MLPPASGASGMCDAWCGWGVAWAWAWACPVAAPATRRIGDVGGAAGLDPRMGGRAGFRAALAISDIAPDSLKAADSATEPLPGVLVLPVVRRSLVLTFRPTALQAACSSPLPMLPHLFHNRATVCDISRLSVSRLPDRLAATYLRARAASALESNRSAGVYATAAAVAHAFRTTGASLSLEGGCSPRASRISPTPLESFESSLELEECATCSNTSDTCLLREYAAETIFKASSNCSRRTGMRPRASSS